MKLEFIKTLWGHEHLELEAVLSRVAADGYHGFETPIGTREKISDSMGLKFIAQGFPMTAEDLKRDLALAVNLDATLLNLQAGKDWWSFEQGCAFFESCSVLIASSPIPVTIETHRGKLFCNPWSTREYLLRFPDLKITADFSHWTCTCESDLSDQKADLDLAISRTIYLHARVGHAEGPQVPDPRTQKWSGWVNRFMAIWADVIASRKAAGNEVLMIDPEFGPPDYLWTDPTSEEPLADQWAVSNWLRDKLAATP